MAIVRLKGLNRVTVTLASGERVTYHYAWKGGPRLPGKPGSPEFVAAYNAAVAERKTRPGDDLAALVARYRASPEFAKNSDDTRRHWGRFLDRIQTDPIGQLPREALDDRRVRADLLDWRDQWADRPRQADYAVQVLGRVLSWSVDRGLLERNAMAGVDQLYQSNRADQIWTAEELARYQSAAPSPEVAFIVPLACLTGMRVDDLYQLAWSHVGPVAIVRPTGKSRGRKVQRIPLIREARELLARIQQTQAERLAQLTAQAERKRKAPPPTPLTVLTNTRGRAWSKEGLKHMVAETKAAAGIDKHLHDTRGTFATRLRKAGLKASEIADVLGWEEERVERLLKVYVDQDDVIQGIIRRIERNESGADSPK